MDIAGSGDENENPADLAQSQKEIATDSKGSKYDLQQIVDQFEADIIPIPFLLPGNSQSLKILETKVLRMN